MVQLRSAKFKFHPFPVHTALILPSGTRCWLQLQNTSEPSVVLVQLSRDPCWGATGGPQSTEAEILTKQVIERHTLTISYVQTRDNHDQFSIRVDVIQFLTALTVDTSDCLSRYQSILPKFVNSLHRSSSSLNHSPRCSQGALIYIRVSDSLHNDRLSLRGLLLFYNLCLMELIGLILAHE